MSIAPSDSQIIRGAIQAALNETMTASIGEVVKYDAKKQVADIQPVMRKFYNVQNYADFDDYPVIFNVPVKWLRAGGFFLTMPLVPGDHVLLVFTHEDIATWRASGQTNSEPDDLRKHDLSSCVAIPGVHWDGATLSSSAAALSARGAGLFFGEDGAARSISFTSDGWIQIGNVEVPALAPAFSPVALGISTQMQVTQIGTQIEALQVEIAGIVANVLALNALAATLVPTTGFNDPSASLQPAVATANGATGSLVATGVASLLAATTAIELAAQTAQSTMLRSV